MQQSFAYAMTSGASTSASNKDTRRAMQQSSLTQVLLPQNGALDPKRIRGMVYIWGSDTAGQLGLGLSQQENKRIILPHPQLMTSLKNYVVNSIAAGSEHCIAVTIEGKCFGWGSNSAYQLGLGPDMPRSLEYPVQIKTVTNMMSAACGYQHSLLLSMEGNLYSMGLGDGGVLGHGNSISVIYPKQIQILKQENIIAAKCGGYHNLALNRQGEVFVWGRGDGGQLGISIERLTQITNEQNTDQVFLHTPEKLIELKEIDVLQIDCGEAHSLVLSDQHQVFGWGWGSNGQLGSGKKQDDFEQIGNFSCIQYTPQPVEFPRKTKIKSISAGGLFSIFITEEFEVFACGMNDFGQLGIEKFSQDSDVSLPTRLDCFRGYPISQVFCGQNHCIASALEEIKATWAWGKGEEGQLGVGDVYYSQTPKPVQALAGFPIYLMACGRVHSLALVGNPGGKVRKKEEISFGVKWECEYLKKLK